MVEAWIAEVLLQHLRNTLCSQADSEQGYSFASGQPKKSSNTLQLLSRKLTKKKKKKGRVFGFLLCFFIQPFGHMNSEMHTVMDFTGTVRIRPVSVSCLIYWPLTLDTLQLCSSHVCLADVASWLNLLCSIAVSTKYYMKANDEISFLIQTRTESQVCWSRAALLSACTSWASGPCDFQPSPACAALKLY